MTVVVASIGTAVPERSMAQAQTLALARRLSAGEVGERIARVYENSGIDRRGSVLFTSEDGQTHQSSFEPPSDREDRGPSTARRLELFRQLAAPLAQRASAQAAGRAGIEPREITHIVTASCTGGEAPGVDQAILRALGCSPDVERTHIGFMGCHAAVNALRIARAIGSSEPSAVVLVCCIELCTLHFQYGARMDGQVANALFADGAAAAIVRAQRAGEPALFAIESTASRVFGDSSDAMSWVIGDHGFEMGLSVRTPALLRENVPGWLADWLAREGLDARSIAAWAIHPGGPRVLDEIRQALGLDESAVRCSREVLRDHGNMSSATILFVLERVRASMAAGERCAAMAFGPGLAAEGLLVRAV